MASVNNNYIPLFYSQLDQNTDHAVVINQLENLDNICCNSLNEPTNKELVLRSISLLQNEAAPLLKKVSSIFALMKNEDVFNAVQKLSTDMESLMKTLPPVKETIKENETSKKDEKESGPSFSTIFSIISVAVPAIKLLSGGWSAFSDLYERYDNSLTPEMREIWDQIERDRMWR